ncbi:PEP-CTERM sorting domain-containing protein [Thauera sp.]|uniref:PEP-CTERM sorting domain-containing protein n=1 Tax=Thauera sp. TaxID=1905334 RepID=UPI0039E5F440
MHISKTLIALAFGICAAQSASAAPMLNPASTAPYAQGSGLSATWTQVRDDYRFSQQPWREPGSAERPIGSYGWGTGVWSTRDIRHVQSLADDDANVVSRVRGTSAVSFANSIYNEKAANGSYGTWGHDYTRPLVPIVEQTGQQTNYVGSFTGYIYIAEGGLYDFSLFVDDGFTFSLFGSDGERLGMERETLAGSTEGRDYFALSDAYGGERIQLGSGYYGIHIDYFNRLEAGVIDLAMKGPSDDDWRGISSDQLFTSIPGQVPEPGTLALLTLGFIGFGASRKRMAQQRA